MSQVLEEIGLWPQIRRFAGASAGAIAASLFSVGYIRHLELLMLIAVIKSVENATTIIINKNPIHVN